jgi:hypothetical protein
MPEEPASLPAVRRPAEDTARPARPARPLGFLRGVLRLLAPLGLLGWLVLAGPWRDLASRLADANWPFVLLALAVNFLVFLPVRALRWRIAMQDPPPLGSVLASMLEGITVGAVFGTAAGDLVRASRLRGRGSFATDLGSSVADRACEYLALGVLLSAVAAAGAVHLGWLAAGPAALLGLLSLARWHDKVGARLARWPRIRAGLSALGGALTPRNVAAMTALAFAGWTAEVLMLHLVLSALGLPSGPGLAALIVVFINVATALPGVPGNLGTFEAGVVLALATASVNREAALSFAIFYHALHLVPTVSLGGVVWLVRGARRPRPGFPSQSGEDRRR